MIWNYRSLAPYVALVGLISALAWAASFTAVAPADFTFCNGTEIKTVDPAIVTGQPEGRIIYGLYEALVIPDPKTLEPIPGVAESWEISDDQLVYTFHLREDARWSDGSPVTAHDFEWSYRRFLHPETGSEYSYQLWYVKNAPSFTRRRLRVGDPLEIELDDRPNPRQAFPSGTIVRGDLKTVTSHVPRDADGSVPHRGGNVYSVNVDGARRRLSAAKVADAERAGFADDLKPVSVGGPIAFTIGESAHKGTLEDVESVPIDADGNVITQDNNVYSVEVDGKIRRFGQEAVQDAEECKFVLRDFRSVGIRALDDRTLRIELANPTPFFLKLLSFYPLSPVNRKCIEEHGYPEWTKPANIVTNGAFNLGFRRIRDRIRLVKNPMYWNAENVALETIDALSVQSSATQLNLYLTGRADWATNVPSSVIPDLRERTDFESRAYLGIYYYRVNVTRPGLDKVKVRRALNLALNKEEVCRVVRGGQQVARSYVPPGLRGYEQAQCGAYDVEEARRLLAEAGYADGAGFPTIEVLYNTNEGHKLIAEVIQAQWQRNLGIKVRLVNQEWAVFLASTSKLEYAASRAGWIGDYADPNTFLDMFVTDGANNQTGWGNADYDRLIDEAAQEADSAKRMKLLHDAEAILMAELPVLPIYYYVSAQMISPYVRGLYPNILDTHPLGPIRIDKEAKRRFSEGAEN